MDGFHRKLHTLGKPEMNANDFVQSIRSVPMLKQVPEAEMRQAFRQMARDADEMANADVAEKLMVRERSHFLIIFAVIHSFFSRQSLLQGVPLCRVCSRRWVRNQEKCHPSYLYSPVLFIQGFRAIGCVRPTL